MKETNMEHFRGEAEEKKYDFGKQKDSSTGKEYLISCGGRIEKVEGTRC